MTHKEEYCNECDEHIDDCECEEYCEDCDNSIDECECENETTLQDINDVLDTANKGLDFLDRVKKHMDSNEPRTISNSKAKFIGQDIERKRRRELEENKNQNKIEKISYKKWKIETIIKIAVPIIAALIGVGFFAL